MPINSFLVKRWFLMLIGKSVWHVNQGIGICFSAKELNGYYNNMTEKVTKMPGLIDNQELPQLNLAGGRMVHFPVAIFQYGLGCYDLYIRTKEQRYKQKFLQCSLWALENLDNEGRWNNFFYVFPDHPYGAMAQGEGVSLLLRAYKESCENRYLNASKKAIDFMIKSIEQGGTTAYIDGNVIFMEYTHLPVVMNGWIFAWWGLYDYVLITDDKGHYKSMLDESLKSMIMMLPKFKCWYWSKYDIGGKMASPFYHNLHVAQMEAMYNLTNRKEFKEYAERWKYQQGNSLFRNMAFLKKVVQKIIEK